LNHFVRPKKKDCKKKALKCLESVEAQIYDYDLWAYCEHFTLELGETHAVAAHDSEELDLSELKQTNFRQREMIDRICKVSHAELFMTELVDCVF
jgi:hypothetical protein